MGETAVLALMGLTVAVPLVVGTLAAVLNSGEDD
jgi:hypothetical protein